MTVYVALTVILVAEFPPIVTKTLLEDGFTKLIKLVPIMVTIVPPNIIPVSGVIVVTVGSATYVNILVIVIGPGHITEITTSPCTVYCNVFVRRLSTSILNVTDVSPILTATGNTVLGGVGGTVTGENILRRAIPTNFDAGGTYGITLKQNGTTIPIDKYI